MSTDRIYLTKLFKRESKHGKFLAGKLGMADLMVVTSKSGDLWLTLSPGKPKEDKPQQGYGGYTQPEQQPAAEDDVPF